jgi:hypothetical protein
LPSRTERSLENRCHSQNEGRTKVAESPAFLSSLTFNVSSTATALIDNSTGDYLGAVLNLSGTTTWSGADIYGRAGGAINNLAGAVFNDTGGNSYTGTGSFTNAGTVNKSGGAASTYFGVPFDNAGTVNVKSGGLTIANGGTLSACTFNVAAGDEVSFPLDSGGYTIGTALFGAISFAGTGTIDLAGGSVSAGLSGATISVSSTTSFQWSSGYLGAPVGATLNLGGVFALVGSTPADLDYGGTVNLVGTFKQTNTGSLRIDGSGDTATTLDIPHGSTYDFQADSGIVEGYNGGGVVDNAGTITKSNGVNTSTITTHFNNQKGTLSVQSGTLTLAPAGGASNGGTFNVTSGAVLDLTGGQTVDYAGTYTGSGGGEVALRSGTLQVVGGSAGTTFSFPQGLFSWSGGTINTNESTLTIAVGKSLQVSGYAGEDLIGGGTLVVGGTVNQTGVANVFVDGGTILHVAKSGVYDLQSDSGIQAGNNGGGMVQNSWTLERTVGTNVSTISTALSSGTLAVDTGTIDVTGPISQVTGAILEAGTWDIVRTPTVASTLDFAAPANLSGIGLGASVTLNGPNSAFTNLATITSNSGSFILAGGTGFTTSGAFSNSGVLTLGAFDTLTVAGDYTQTTWTLAHTIDGRPSSDARGTIVASGASALGGTLSIAVPQSFMPTLGDSYAILSYASHSGSFKTMTGLKLPGSIALEPAYNTKNFTLTVAKSSGSTSAGSDPKKLLGRTATPAYTVKFGSSQGHPGHSRPTRTMSQSGRPSRLA